MTTEQEAPHVVSASREIAAGPGRIFELIADPAQQPRWDGNDNLAEAPDGQRVRRRGDVFTMTLTRGAIRENHVVEFDEGRQIAWMPAEPGQRPPGHLWRWELEPAGPSRTRVTCTYDWTQLTDETRLPRARATTADRLQASLDLLAGLAEMNGTGLVRDPSSRLADGIVTHISRTRVDVALARAQHAAYADALAASGWTIRRVPAADDCPDSVFVEDTVVICEDLAVLTRPGAPARRAEVAGVAQAVRSLGLRTACIDEPGTLDGGDILQAGHTVYAGRGGRTNGEGIRQLRSLLAPLGRTVVPVPLGKVLHLKSAVTALPDGTFLLLPELVPAGLFPAVRPVTEEAGSHVVPLGGDRVLIAASAPRTAELLGDLGFTPVVVEISEFEKLEGCVTCLSVLLPGR